MFRAFVAAILLVLVSGCAGMQQVTEADRTLDGVFEASGFSKDQIFTATKIWIAENFRSAKSVIEYENKEEGTLIGNGIIPYPCSGLEHITKADWTVSFTMRVDIKDQKFKLTFSNVRLSWPPSYNSTFGSQRGHDGPVRLQGDMDAIEPKLLSFGNALLVSMSSNKKAKDW